MQWEHSSSKLFCYLTAVFQTESSNHLLNKDPTKIILDLRTFEMRLNQAVLCNDSTRPYGAPVGETAYAVSHQRCSEPLQHRCTLRAGRDAILGCPAFLFCVTIQRRALGGARGLRFKQSNSSDGAPLLCASFPPLPRPHQSCRFSSAQRMAALLSLSACWAGTLGMCEGWDGDQCVRAGCGLPSRGNGSWMRPVGCSCVVGHSSTFRCTPLFAAVQRLGPQC